ncbi:LamG-like jellyroll fold domain-containing protein [Paracoccus litorisediminis]|uniref:Concanavalin A-like lectin/glucanases superfamily protein n=1 Tax=Paracoccus litorisediminis TaxID=2006130 RepID=A0A844HGY5_9RHOB|nr:LamG-like jellyroll fold domain-containing protein [Paracoccus litorisediminis]MTH57634.1 hypothetical protein [Paracoccus litorisediminis]
MTYTVVSPNAADFAGAVLPPVGSIADLADIEGFCAALMAPAGSGLVTSWAPLVGTFSLTKASGAENPEYAEVDGFRVIRYAGQDDMSFSPTGLLYPSTEMTFGIRAKFHPGPSRGIIFGDGSNNLYIDISSNNTLRFVTGGGANAFISAPITTNDVWHTVICTHSDGQSRIDIDGVQVTGAGASMTPGATFFLGAWAAGTAMVADVRKLLIAKSNTFGSADYEMVKTFLG